jgi:hypothetical protein
MSRNDPHEQKMLNILRKTDCWSGIPLLRTAFNKGKWRIFYWSARSIHRLLDRLEKRGLAASKYDFVPVAGVKVAKLFFRINGSENEKCSNQLKDIRRSAKTPPIGEIVLHCGHVVGEFTFWNVPDGMDFMSPDGEMGSAKWIMACRECDEASKDDPNQLRVKGDIEWSEKYDDMTSDILLQQKCQALIAEVLEKVPEEYESQQIYVDLDTDNPNMKTAQVLVVMEDGKGFLLKKIDTLEFEETPILVEFKMEEGKIVIEKISTT